MLHASVYAVADDSPISEETGPVAERVCSIGILMYVLVNVCSCRGNWEEFETAKGLSCVALLGCYMQLSLARRACEESISYMYIQTQAA